MTWNPKELAERFSREALEAERYAKECKQKVDRSDQYCRWADEADAKFMFNYRFADEGRTASPEIMLEWLTNFDPAEFSNQVFDRAVFEGHIRADIARWTKRAREEVQERIRRQSTEKDGTHR